MNPVVSAIHTLRFHARRLCGPAGAIGLALMLVAVGALTVGTRKWSEESARVRHETRRLNQEILVASRAPHENVSVGQQLQQFNTWFPPVENSTNDLRLLFSEAKKYQLELNKGEYQMKQQAGKALVDFDVVLPVKASYPGIRRFVAAVLNAAPHASLAELRMERQGAGTTLLDARIRFTFVYRGT